MSNSSMDWAYLDSANEVVVGATVPLARLVSVPDLAPAPGPGPAAEFGGYGLALAETKCSGGSCNRRPRGSERTDADRVVFRAER